MMVSRSARVLFVHVQKTGGSTVDVTLPTVLPDATYVRGLRGGRHARLGPALREHPELADYWTFGFVRNPWARMLSWYSMIGRRSEAAESGNEVAAGKFEKNRLWRLVHEDHASFESFVMQATDELVQLRTPQIDYLRTATRRADFIGRTESFDDDFRTVLEHLGAPLPERIEHRNAGPRSDYREHYTDEMRERIATLFAADVDEFGYEF